MRRLLALVLTMSVAWVVVARLGTEQPGSSALALGVALLSASIVGWLLGFLHLPKITGYLIFGLLCGPSFANILTQSMARDLQVLNGFAIVIIAFVAGLQFDLAKFRPRLVALAGFSVITVGLAWVGLTALVWTIWRWLPLGVELTPVQTLAASALVSAVLVSVSPTVTVAVIAESRARGNFTDLATAVVVLVELVVIVLFAIVLQGSRWVFGLAPPDEQALAAATLWTLTGSVAFGAMMGAAFGLYLKLVGREITVVLLALAAVVAGIGGQLQLDPMLSGLAAGLIVRTALGPAGDLLRDAVARGARPVLVLFFATLGASMHVEPLATVGAAALALSLGRVLLLRAASDLAAQVTRLDATDASLLWRALLSTADVTLMLTVIVAAEYAGWGQRLQTVMVAVVALHELVGPILFRAALAERREVGGASGGLVVVSNREPWVHEYMPDGSIRARPTPGGVSVALDALMRDRGGVWVAHAAGSADRAVVDERGSVDVPPDAPAYRLRRLWISADDEEKYYGGYANTGLWPLCHQAHVRPVFRADDWDAYQRVNKLFADTVAIEAPPEASVFLNDYHLAMVAKYLRARRPLLRTALFWHIPWPDSDRLRICPQRKDLLEGLLSNDLLAFQLPRDQRNFLQAAADELNAATSGDIVYFGDRPVRVVAIPIGADFDRIVEILADQELESRMRQLTQELGLEGCIVGIGVDRLDYTKGIPERMAAIDRALTERPDLAEKLVFVQIGVPSREDVPGYAEISQEIDELVAQVNAKHGRGDHRPIRYLKKSFQMPDLVALYRLARFGIVSSLHDGMNLVAKEFVAARDDLDGVLILSELAGAAQELEEALIINPYDERGFTDAILQAVDMPSWERRRRMQALRRRVAGRDVLAWASDILERLERPKGLGFLAG